MCFFSLIIASHNDLQLIDSERWDRWTEIIILEKESSISAEKECTKYLYISYILTTVRHECDMKSTTVLVKQHFAINQKSLKFKKNIQYLNSIADEQAGFHYKIKINLLFNAKNEIGNMAMLPVISINKLTYEWWVSLSSILICFKNFFFT